MFIPNENFLVYAITNHKSPSGGFYLASIGLRKLPANKLAYFAFTLQQNDQTCFYKSLGADLYNTAEQLLMPLHLSDLHGVPLHAVENGWYYVQIARGVAEYHTPQENDRVLYTNHLANHLRIPRDQAVDIVDNTPDKEAFIALVDTMRDRWQNEAIEAYKFLKSIKHLSQE